MSVRFAGLGDWNQPDPSVKKQHVSWSSAGEVLGGTELPPNVTTRDSVEDQVTVGPGQELTISVVWENEVGMGQPWTASATAPSLPGTPVGTLTLRKIDPPQT